MHDRRGWNGSSLETAKEEQEKHAVLPIEIRSCQSELHADGGTLLFCLQVGITVSKKSYYLSISR
jgi:hypothetical protein